MSLQNTPSQTFYRVLNTLLCSSIHENEIQITQPAITCSKLTIKTAERCHQLRSGVFIVNFEHIFTPCSSVSIVNFEQVNAGWESDGWLHFIKWFSTNSRIEQAFITQTFLETRNWKIKSKAVLLLVWKVFIEKRERNNSWPLRVI